MGAHATLPANGRKRLPTAEMEGGGGQISDGIIAVEGRVEGQKAHRRAGRRVHWAEGHPSYSRRLR